LTTHRMRSSAPAADGSRSSPLIFGADADRGASRRVDGSFRLQLL
jgi:hypothetical protein